MKHFLLLIVLLSIVALSAQYSDSWNFSSSTEEYAEITGGTVLGTAVVGSVGALSLDDVLYTLPDTSIPFAFRIDNVVYSGLTISTNGQVIFGGSTYLGHSPLSSTVPANTCIAVLARDLQGLVIEGSLGEMRYQVVGTAPSREFVIQWKNFKKYLTVNNNENYNFQLRLQETTNRVRITYGAMTVNATNGNPQVGIRGTNNTQYVGRTTTTDWAATTAATVNTATCTLTDTVKPAAGLCMDFTQFVPANLSGTVLGAGNQPLAGVAVQIANTTHSTTTNTLGQYSITNIFANAYTVNFSKFGYTTQSQDVTLIEGQTEILDVTLVQLALVSLSGTVLASDTGAGLANATLQFTGYQDYTVATLANGTYTLPAVYANQSYSYTVTCPGYVDAAGSVAVGEANHTVPPITLSEVAFAPYGVVATLNGQETQALLSWHAPDPDAVEITESFESASFPPQDWTRVINCTGPANEQGILPTWCSFGTTTYYSYPAVPSNGIKQAGIGFTFSHQDEWLISPSFACPPASMLSFTSFVYRGSTYGDSYNVKLSLNDGQDWIVLWNASSLTGGHTTTATPFTIDMQAYGGQQIKIAFHARDPLTGPNANMGLWYDWYIDNIVIGNSMSSIRLNPSEMTSLSARASEAQNTGRVRSEASDRALTGYKVWRLREGQETNESLWAALTPAQVTTTSYADNAWSTLSNGTYRWAIRAIYTNGVASLPVLSNSLTRAVVSGTVQGVVRKPNNQPLGGATISAGGNTATTNSSGLYSLSLPVGVYSVTCSAQGYQPSTVSNITIIADQSVTQNFTLAISANEDDLVPVMVTALNGNYPNPFNPETTISYAIKEAGDVRLEVFNLKGQKVRSLVNGRQSTGHYSIVFDARDDKGQALSSGIYLYRLTAQNYLSTRKMMLME